MAEVLNDPRVEHLGLTEEIEHPRAGRLKFVGSAVSYEGLGRAEPAPPPLVGEHTRKILAELGYGENRARELEREGVIGPVP
jgi:crotonobetainyl-CoA:carnitine CoA-transferase CaiB-like acyl-CoA transferase